MRILKAGWRRLTRLPRYVEQNVIRWLPHTGWVIETSVGGQTLYWSGGYAWGDTHLCRIMWTEHGAQRVNQALGQHGGTVRRAPDNPGRYW
jgi:hypothetical protein